MDVYRKFFFAFDMIAIGFDFLVTTAIRFLCRRFATENEAILAEFLTKTILLTSRILSPCSLWARCF